MTRQEQMEALGFTQWEIKQVIADERRRMVVRLRDAGLTARQIADRMGVSRSRPGQLEMRALHARSSVLERAATSRAMDKQTAVRLHANLQRCTITLS